MCLLPRAADQVLNAGEAEGVVDHASVDAVDLPKVDTGGPSRVVPAGLPNKLLDIAEAAAYPCAAPPSRVESDCSTLPDAQ